MNNNHFPGNQSLVYRVVLYTNVFFALSYFWGFWHLSVLALFAINIPPSIPSGIARLIVLVSSVYLIACDFIYTKSRRIHIGELALLSFFAFYFCRLVYDLFISGHFYSPVITSNYLIYSSIFLAFGSCISLWAYSERSVFLINRPHYIIIASLFFDLVAVVAFRGMIGDPQYNLRSTEISSEIATPLYFSNIGAISVILGIWMLIFAKTSVFIKMLSALTALLGVPCISLGGGRTSFFQIGAALFVMFVFVVLKYRKALLPFFITGIIVLVVFAGYLAKSKAFLNVNNMLYDYRMGNASMVRLDIWRLAWHEFLSSPIWGNFIIEPVYAHHAHNLFIDVLMATGILGAIPFFTLLYLGLCNSYRLAMSDINYSWVFVLLISQLVNELFHGSVWGSSSFYTILGLAITAHVYYSRPMLKRGSNRAHAF